MFDRYFQKKISKKALKYSEKISSESERFFTFEVFDYFAMSDEEKKKYVGESPNSLKKERDYIKVEIEKQKKGTFDFTIAVLGVLIAVFAIAFSYYWSCFDSDKKDLEAINNELSILQEERNQWKRDLPGMYELTVEQQEDVNRIDDGISEGEIKQSSLQKSICSELFFMIVIIIALIVILGILLSIYFRYEYNCKLSAIIIVAYKERLDYLNDLINEKEKNNKISYNSKKKEVKKRINSCNESFYKKKLKNKYGKK